MRTEPTSLKLNAYSEYEKEKRRRSREIFSFNIPIQVWFKCYSGASRSLNRNSDKPISEL